MKKKMELKLQYHGSWYGEDIKNFSKNAVWHFLHDEKYTITDIKNLVEKSIQTGKPFNIELTFKSGAGQNTAWLIMQEMTDIK